MYCIQGRRTLYKAYGIKFVIIVQGRAGTEKKKSYYFSLELLKAFDNRIRIALRRRRDGDATYIKWKLRTRYTKVVFLFATGVDLTKCLKQVKLPISTYVRINF